MENNKQPKQPNKPPKRERKEEKLTQQDLEELMNMHMPTYKRVNGRIRRR